jgi:hypothetical protein
MHGKTTRPLTASERIRLARKVSLNAQAKLAQDRLNARRSFALDNQPGISPADQLRATA